MTDILNEGSFADLFSDIYNVMNRKEINTMLAAWKKHVDSGKGNRLHQLAKIVQKNGVKIRPAELRDIVDRMVNSGKLDQKYVAEDTFIGFKEFIDDTVLVTDSDGA